MIMSSGRSSLEAAATLPGEYEVLSQVVADLRDDAPKLRYADWLEERGDRRAKFVRKFAAAVRSLGPTTRLPAARSFRRAWTNMLGVPLVEGLVEFGLVDVKDLVFGLARPIVTIAAKRVREDRNGTGSSKFGGHPDLPAGVPWPACEKGPLGFLGQIALRDLENSQVARELPPDGLLSFFAYQEDGYQPGVVDEVPGDTRVLYTPASRPLERQLPPPDLDVEFNGIFPTCRLAFCESWDLPAADATALPELQEEARSEGLFELRARCHPFGHHLMGYSVHSRTTDPSPGPDWRHLLCLDSDERLGWNWCDGEHLAVFVREEDLRTGTFARVYGYAS
jgi:uncharacterized protein (TIGR02996 family)